MGGSRMTEYYPTFCPCCERYQQGVERRRMNTNYVEAESNFMTSCEECFEDSEAHWSEMWREYYSGCL